jgi:hypothetical protein
MVNGFFSDLICAPQMDMPEKAFRNCYTWRTLVHFAGFLGLAEVEPITEKRLCHQYRVRALPLLRQVVQFRIARRNHPTPQNQ